MKKSKHVKQRMGEREISKELIDLTIKKGKILAVCADSLSVTMEYKGIVVVTCAEFSTIITAYHMDSESPAKLADVLDFSAAKKKLSKKELTSSLHEVHSDEDRDDDEFYDTGDVDEVIYSYEEYYGKKAS